MARFWEQILSHPVIVALPALIWKVNPSAVSASVDVGAKILLANSSDPREKTPILAIIRSNIIVVPLPYINTLPIHIGCP